MEIFFFFSGEVMLAKMYDSSKHYPGGWVATEKFDGVRARWNGRELLSRYGKNIYAPDWWLAENIKFDYLDGELWCGRGQFQRTVSIVRSKRMDCTWELVKFVPIDLMNGKSFRENWPLIKGFHEHYLELPYTKFDEPLEDFLQKMYSLGGEGAMLRNPDTVWTDKRVDFLLKLKPELIGEGLVVEILPGEGKYSGMMGAVLLKWNGIFFKVGSGFSDQERSEGQKFLGKSIRFKYMELTRAGVPRLATKI